MKKHFLILIMMIYSSGLIAQQATLSDKSQRDYIEVNGSSEMEVTPDLIYLRIVISEKDKKMEESVERQENKMTEKLRKLGIKVEDDLSVINYNGIYSQYWIKKNEVIKSKEYELLVRTPMLMAQVYAELEELGIKSIRIDRLNHTKMDEFKNEVRVRAIKAARDKAQLLAGAIDQKIGKAIYINENYTNLNVNQNRFANNSYQLNEVVIARGISSQSLDYANKLEDVQIRKLYIKIDVLVQFSLL